MIEQKSNKTNDEIEQNERTNARAHAILLFGHLMHRTRLKRAQERN